MNEKNFEYLKNQVRELGFPERIAEQINDYMKANNQAFNIYYFNQVEEDQLMYDLRFAKSSKDTYQLTEYELTYKQVDIPDLNIQGVNTKDLEHRLKEVEGWYDRFLEENIEHSISKEEYKEITQFIEATNNDLYRLPETEKGEAVAKLLMYKYLPQSEYEKVFQGYQEMQKQHEHKHLFPVNDDVTLTAMDDYQFLKTEANNSKEHNLNTLINDHVISHETLDYINSGLLKGNKWIAYNTASYFLEKSDVYFFKSKDEAKDFAESNISEFDNYKVIKATSVEEVLKQIPYGEQRFELFAENIRNESKEIQFSLARDNNSLYNKLEELGFGDKLNEAISFYEKYPQEHFQLPIRERNEEEAIDYWLHFHKADNTNSYQLIGYNATLRIYPEIPNVTIKGINTARLEEAMKHIDWSIEHHTESLIEHRMQTKSGMQELKVIESIFHDVNKLHNIPEGKEVAEKLMFKYWSCGPYEPNQFSLRNIKQQYQFTYTTPSIDMVAKTVAYEILHANAAEKLLNKTISIAQKTTFMNQKNYDYLQDQVKFTGFGDALENDLKEKMQKQSPEFQMYHNTKFGNDTAVATLHFKKSQQSDMYFFNKYNLTIKPENSTDMMEQTFYINKGNNITLKEAYNLMSGRAINKDLTNKEGQVYNAWIQMDLKETDKNGNYQLKHFHTNYGFDLEKELAKHPVKELTNEQDKIKLVESLKKGNRQSVTFVKEGGEQRMFIEANPQFKSLKVYDSNMQPVHRQSQKEQSSPKQSLKQEAKKESQKPADDDSEGVPKTKQKRTKRKSQSIS